MEYTFGVIGSNEYVRVKEIDENFNIEGTQTVVIAHPDSIVTHKFRIRHMLKKTDNYVWYVIDNHLMIVDKTPKLEAENKKLRAMIDYISMMTDIELEVEEDEQQSSGI